MKRISLAVLALLMTAQQCFAGGVALSTTRVIYDGGKKEASLTVENHNKNEEFENKNVLQIAVRTRLKLFYRPKGLPGSNLEAMKQLRFQRQNNQIVVNNDSAYNLTFNQMSINGQKIERAGMVLAKGTLNINLPAGTGNANEVKYSIINDFGVAGEMLTKSIN